MTNFECSTVTSRPSTDERGVFVNQQTEDGHIKFNHYHCEHCLKAGIEHTVRQVPHGTTNSRSHWGSGVPSTRRECSACGRWDGPWVSSDIVGGGW